MCGVIACLETFCFSLRRPGDHSAVSSRICVKWRVWTEPDFAIVERRGSTLFYHSVGADQAFFFSFFFSFFDLSPRGSKGWCGYSCEVVAVVAAVVAVVVVAAVADTLGSKSFVWPPYVG
jgi:hypothetical protein